MSKWKYDEHVYSFSNDNAYVCFLTNTLYIPGVLVLAHSLSRVLSRYPLYVIVPNEMKNVFEAFFCEYNIRVIAIPNINIDSSVLDKSVVTENVDYWKNTFFKLQVSKLHQFKKLVLLDADMIVVKNIDHLFDCPHMSAVAAGQIKHADWTELNSGIMVITPNAQFEQYISDNIDIAFSALIKQQRSFGDQDIFNFCYSSWPTQHELHLPETYNAMSDCINPIAQKYGFKNIYVGHFIGKYKPWHRNITYIAALFKEAVKQLRFSEFRLFMKYYLTLRKVMPSVFNKE